MDRSEYLRTYEKYQLGVLPTETPHPKTKGLAEKAQQNLVSAIDVLKAVDLDALEKFRSYAEPIEDLRKSVEDCLEDGGRIFLVGCGATGRLSLLNEFLFREKYGTDQVVSLMAGGDIALVHSLEGFEDYPEFGEMHLKQLGFSENDLLIATTEGGETPYVIGATEFAASASKRQPYFLYCNPTEILCEKVQRSKDVVNNTAIKKICLFVGPMALSGSTRMQASTVLQLAVGFALVERDKSVSDLIEEMIQELKLCDFSQLEALTQKEASIYKNGDYVMYAPKEMAITVFTDTTERSPTFSQPSFESSRYRGSRPSLCYIQIPQASNKDEAWEMLLKHKPRPLNWTDVDRQTTDDYLNDFDFSSNSLEDRALRIGGKQQFVFVIDVKGSDLVFALDGVELRVPLATERSLIRHTILKLLLNTHSTLLMALLGRYKSNIMTWVTATNGKLIDRASRYVDLLLQEKGIKKDYLEIVNTVFDMKDQVSEGECVVLNVLSHLEDQS